MKLIKNFSFGLKKTSSFLSSNILGILSKKKIDEETIENLENILISSDIGIEVTNILINKIKLSKI